MDALAGLLIGILMYGIPIILGGLPIFIVITLIAWVIGCIKEPREPKKRKRILRNWMFIGVISGLVLGIYVYLGIGFYMISNKEKTPRELIYSKYFVESRRDGRHLFWDKGTIASLSQWIEQNGKESKHYLRERLHAKVEENISFALNFKSKFDVDSNDLAILETLSLEFNAKEPADSRLLLPNFLNIKRNGFRDFSVAMMTINEASDTYLMMAIRLCTNDPLLEDCQRYITIDNISAFELRHDNFHETTKQAWEYKLEELRRTKGIKNRINLCKQQWCVNNYKQYLCRKTKNPDPEWGCPPPPIPQL